jgi:hypothetical protein
MKKREFIALLIALFLIHSCSKETELKDTNSETPTTANCECNDGIDNDGDGLIDSSNDLGCTGANDCSEGGLATGSLENGWTVIEPATNTIIYYVSTSDGDDQNDGISPTTPKKTIAAAMALARNNSPDWVLLKRGDVFTETLTLKKGIAANTPFVISSYGDSKDRPLLKTGANSGIEQVLEFQNIIISGLAFYAHTRNPQSNEFVSYQGSTGFNFYRKAGKPGNNLIIEDCSFNFYAGNVIQGAQPPKNITLRRNIFTNNYSDAAHSQGLYMAFCESVLLEENIFDHNGWLIQAIPPFNNVKANGQATYFNHNFYGTSLKNATLKGNVFSRGSSIGTKFTADNGPGSASNIIIDNNIYIDGEIGISIGGNDFNASYRFKDINIANNVMLDIGKSKPTTRGLAWYIDIDDWDNGMVEKNLLLHQADPQIGNTFGINIAGVSRDITIQENIIHGLRSGQPLLSSRDNNADKSNILITKNDVVAPSHNAVLMGFPNSVSNYTFLQNTYYSTSSSDKWFQIGTTYSSITAWENLTNDGASTTLPVYDSPDRTIEVYQTSIGKPSSIDGFITEITKQSKFNWNADYNVPSVNNWFRKGFNLKTLSN